MVYAAFKFLLSLSTAASIDRAAECTTVHSFQCGISVRALAAGRDSTGMKRQVKNSKFGFGGRKKLGKQNSAASTADMGGDRRSSGGGKGGGDRGKGGDSGKGGGKGKRAGLGATGGVGKSKRPGKDARAAKRAR